MGLHDPVGLLRLGQWPPCAELFVTLIFRIDPRDSHRLRLPLGRKPSYHLISNILATACPNPTQQTGSTEGFLDIALVTSGKGNATQFTELPLLNSPPLPLRVRPPLPLWRFLSAPLSVACLLPVAARCPRAVPAKGGARRPKRRYGNHPVLWLEGGQRGGRHENMQSPRVVVLGVPGCIAGTLSRWSSLARSRLNRVLARNTHERIVAVECVGGRVSLGGGVAF